MPGIQVGFESRGSFLERMAILLSEPLRLKIVTELFLREMSPTLFFEEFGGGSVSRVARHFDVLAKYGWLRFIRSETGGERRGGVEHFYRARELAFFDSETWAELPYSIRAEFSSTIFTQFAERITEAMRAGTFDARDERHFTWSAILLDETGWKRVIAAVDALFGSLFEEQEDARLRVFKSGEDPFLATVGLTAFESPRPDFQRSTEPVGLSPGESPAYSIPFSRRISKVFADPLCLKIVTELNLEEMSATGFYRKFKCASRSPIYRRFKLLSELGWLREVSQKSGGKRRGATERFFRAAGPLIFDNRSWSDVPEPLKRTFSWTIFEQFSEQVKDAIDAATLDARLDRHFSWSLLLLDQRGWENVIEALDALFAFITEEQVAAERRALDSHDERIRMTVALAGFESPKDAVKAP